jgi:PTH1 family peptidyl-tRNA hydrolase
LSVVLGLGNPGADYRYTRHNVGFLVLEQAVMEAGLKFRTPLFRPWEYARLKNEAGTHLMVKPQTFMNRSGIVVPPLCARARCDASDLIVICDNMDLECGRIRIRRGGSDAGHNGIKSVIAYAQRTDFLRLYVGIGRPEPSVSVVDHVLGIPGVKESKLLHSGLDKAADALLQLLGGADEQKVMNEFNRALPS